jgi:hypothetical protein
MNDLTKEDHRSFSQIYKEIPQSRADFVEHMMAITMKSKSTIYNWIYEQFEPDELTKSILEKDLGVPAEDLFPKKVIAKDTQR